MRERKGDIGMGAGGHQGSVLLTLGRLPVALELARAFAAAGWRVVVLDSMSWHLCRASKAVHKCIKVPSPKAHPNAYKQAILDIIENEDITWVVPVSEESAYVADISEHLPGKARLIGMDQAHWLRLHDKLRCMQWFNSAGLAVPHTQTLTEVLTVSTRATQACVLKRRFTAAGTGLHFLTAEQSFPAIENPDDWVVQPRLSGVEWCVFSVFNHGDLQLYTGYTGSLMDGSVSVAFERVDLPQALLHWLVRFGELTQYTGMVSFDFMQDNHSGWCALECNPRATSGIHFIDPDRLATVLTGALTDSSNGSDSGLVRSLIEQEPAHLGARYRMEFWSCFTLCFSHRGRKTASKHRNKSGLGPIVDVLRCHRDVTWSAADPVPFLSMPVVNLSLLWRAFRRRETLAESAVADISWPPHD